MKIYVRRRHIRGGRPNTPNHCPIALAIQEQLGTASEATDISEYDIVLGRSSYECPTRAKRFIRNFDAGKPVKPFAFVLQ